MLKNTKFLARLLNFQSSLHEKEGGWLDLCCDVFTFKFLMCPPIHTKFIIIIVNSQHEPQFINIPYLCTVHIKRSGYTKEKSLLRKSCYPIIEEYLI
jgi:hypothetical protein